MCEAESIIFYCVLIFFIAVLTVPVAFLLIYGVGSFLLLHIRVSAPKSKDEDWFIAAAGDIFSLALNWNEPSCVAQTQLEKKLEEKITRYNKESLKVGKWHYRCPQSLSLEYLGIVKNTAEAGGDNK